jgi:ribosomal protein S2
MSISTIQTTRTADLLTVSIPLNNMNSEAIETMLDFLKSSLMIQKSEMSQTEADEISEEIKSSWWEKNKSRIEKMIGENE